MPRCNLTLKQKCQIIELSAEYSTDQLAKKFHVHPTTVTRTLQKKEKILDHASRVNVNFKTVQTNQRGEEHDTLVLSYIREKQNANEPLTIEEICIKAVEFAKTLNRNIKSKRGWWRRFKVRCNIVRSRLQKGSGSTKAETNRKRILDKSISQRGKHKNYTFKIKEFNNPPTQYTNKQMQNTS